MNVGRFFMAKNRYIHTKFWSDGYIYDLNKDEKLLFLYLLTNERTHICGVYELPIGVMASETKLSTDEVDNILKKFEKDKKIFYKHGWVGIKNFFKHQKLNPKTEKGILIGLDLVPRRIKALKAYQSLSKASNYINLNSNLNLNKDTFLKNSKFPKTKTQYS